MNTKSPENNDSINQIPSIKEVGKMFDGFLQNPTDKGLIISFLGGLPGLAERQLSQQIRDTTKTGINNLKKTITV